MLLMCRRRLLDHAALQDEDLQCVVLSCYRELLSLVLAKLELRHTDMLHLLREEVTQQRSRRQLSGKFG